MAKKKSLLIVESPAKANTIKKYLGSSFNVMASIGHVKDLPKSKLGVDVEKNFEVNYQIMPSKKKVLGEIKKAAKAASHVYLAPDPDREGEAIAWHIAEEIGKHPSVQRVLFNAITKDSVKKAIDEPIKLDMNKVNSQQARRVLDRLVGYKISPILWEKVMRGLSAGRVQSVALRLIVEREAEIKAFKPEEYWEVEAELAKGKSNFLAKLFKVKGKDPDLSNEADTKKLLKNIEGKTPKVVSVEKKERKRHAYPPFITSRLQQEASRKLGFSASKTMMLAQRLYEGLELGDEGTQGLITYMRTDSVRIVPEAIEAARKFIKSEYGKEYLPETANTYKTKKSAQDAHEAIRPTNMVYTPKFVKEFLEKDMYKLYTLIWNRFVSSQMSSAIYDQTRVDIEIGDVTFRANGSIEKFAGFTKIYTESKDDSKVENKKVKEEDDSGEEELKILPEIKVNDAVKVTQMNPSQHFTQPPPRYSDASLIKDLEEKGIGRPSTYAAILSNIEGRKYVEKIEKKYHPTKLGTVVVDLLIGSFPKIMDVEFTAGMEEELDLIEEGKLDWKKALKAFYGPFEKTLEEAKENMKNLKAIEVPTDFKCEKCGSMMVVKWGRNGEFLACSKYPECKSTREFRYLENGDIEPLPEEIVPDVKCPNCGSQMLLKNGRFGKFLACSKYPECKTTQALRQLLGIKCPKCKDGDLVKKTAAKSRKAFYACNKYPNCDFLVNDKPIAKDCPKCGNNFLLEKTTKTKGKSIYCYNENCDFKEAVYDDETESKEKEEK